MTPHIIELIIVAIVLIALYIISKRVDDGLKFLNKEIDYIENDVQTLYSSFKGLDEKELSFQEKVKIEEKRVNGVITGIGSVGSKVKDIKLEVNNLTERIYNLENHKNKEISFKTKVKK